MTVQAALSETAGEAPSLADQAAFVEWVRQYRGPEHVWVRQEAEDSARRMLDQFAGRMTVEQAYELGRTFNTDSKAARSAMTGLRRRFMVRRCSGWWRTLSYSTSRFGASGAATRPRRSKRLMSFSEIR